MITVFLVDDHELARRGIAGLLEAESDIDVIGEAGTAAQARSRILATRPDVAVLDVRLPDGSGIDVCRDIRSKDPAIRCLMLTAYDDDDAIYAAVIAGAAGYVLKDIRGSGLVESVRNVAAGKNLLDPALAAKVVERMRAGARADPRLASLSTRERQIMALIADGLTNREIGLRLALAEKTVKNYVSGHVILLGLLALAEKTVKNYVSGLLSKLGLQSRTQAAVLHLETNREAQS